MPPPFVQSKIFEILDLLDADGGWLTTTAFEFMIDMKGESVRRTLSRLQASGFIEGRPRRLREEPSPEYEWRITPAGRERIDRALAAA